jgi:ABC-2 type transport system ATP-binding protein
MDYVLQTRNLTKDFGKVAAVNKVDMNVHRGDIYGFIGENGAGKTTLMRMVCGLARPTEGSMELFGSRELEMQRKRIGCTIENPAIYPNMTAAENLETYRILMGIPDKNTIVSLLELVELHNVGRKKTRDFSLGMKQRLMIALAMMGDPELLVLDEPMNGLDPMGIKKVRDLILKLNHERSLTILISSHILDELAKIATCYGVISKGVLVKEFSAKELDILCRRSLKIVVDDTDKAEEVLRTKVNTTNYDLSDHTILLHDHLDESGDINRELVNNDVRVDTIVPVEQSLEGYFMDLMRGRLDA